MQFDKEDVLPTNYEVLRARGRRARRDDRAIATGGSGAIARGLGPTRQRSLKVDDSDTPPFINAETNEPGKGPNGAHIFLDGDEAIRKMTVGKGLKVELFASEKEFPELVNPVQMAFDTQRPAVGGRVEELSALAAEDADGRQAADPRGHRRRRQGGQAHGVRRRSRTTRPASSSGTAA